MFFLDFEHAAIELVVEYCGVVLGASAIMYKWVFYVYQFMKCLRTYLEKFCFVSYTSVYVILSSQYLASCVLKKYALHT
jgi:hypothetical protein